jgi:Cu2+-containing amine oxidase
MHGRDPDLPLKPLIVNQPDGHSFTLDGCNYPTQSGPDTGITRWIEVDAPLVGTDVVLWYVFGIHHITRPEDWPVMPVDTISFWIKPFGFFDRNPTLDLANDLGQVATK